MTFEEWWVERNKKPLPEELGTWEDYEVIHEAWNAGIASTRALFLLTVYSLMNMVNQHCTHNGKLSHGCLSSNEEAFDVLMDVGAMTKVDGKYTLDWEWGRPEK